MLYIEHRVKNEHKLKNKKPLTRQQILWTKELKDLEMKNKETKYDSLERRDYVNAIKNLRDKIRYALTLKL